MTAGNVLHLAKLAAACIPTDMGTEADFGQIVLD